MKNIALSIICILNIFFSPCALAKSINNRKAKLRLKGTIEKVIKKGERIDVLPETVFNSEISFTGDFVSALISPDDANKLKVPFGSKLIGEVTKVRPAKSMNRDGLIEVQVSELLLPDGQSVAVDAKFKSSGKQQVKKFSKEAAKEISEVLASSAVGAHDAIMFTGLPLAIASSGLSVGIGTGIGMGLGLAHALGKEGDAYANSGFSTNTLKLVDDFVFLEELPIMAENLKPMSPETFGVKLEVNEISKMFSKDFGDFLLFDVALKNMSPEEVFVGDFVLASKKHLIPLMNNPFITNRDIFKGIESNHQESFKLAFSLAKASKKDDYKLQLIDPSTDNILVDFGVDIAKYL